MAGWHTNSLKIWFVPGGVLLLVTAGILGAPGLSISSQAVDFYYYSVFCAGVLLAWRFHSTRVLFALLTLVLGHHAMEFFSAGHPLSIGPGRIAYEAMALLVPTNFLFLSLWKERGFVAPAIASRLVLLFIESVFVAVLCRPGETMSPNLLRINFLKAQLFDWTRIPQPGLLAFFGVSVALIVRLILYRKPVDQGFFWCLSAALLGLQAGATGTGGNVYFATGGLILAASLIENSYFLAYHDELTTLPGRRAFYEALQALESPYTLAALDIDHFKKVNDTYGHDVGDQVLRLVATRLSRISSGGQAYRVGGEEFSILFPGKTVSEVLPDLDALRILISESSFRVRSSPERRKTSRGSDRRRDQLRNRGAADTSKRGDQQLSVTVSIGVAQQSRGASVEDTVQAADKALYQAKRSGRNRVESAGSRRKAARGGVPD
ncbi:MAG TPA: GGDEF domain-containing protein [Terriglobales bacterium]|nr:GGDEF domain-containing protein [Terriglobales bacterium]